MASTISDDLKVTSLQVGSGATPANVTGGSGAASATNRANGSLHMRSDADSLPEVIHNSAVSKLALAGRAIECRLGNLTANQANTYVTYMPRGAIITGVRRRYTTAPASAGGTVVVGITVAGNQILASASESDEGLSNDTMTAHSLTGTTSYLKVNKGDKVVITITSNNADMTGGTDCQYEIDYDDN